MKLRHTIAIVFFSCALFAFSCQKGIHWTFASEGELTKDADGNCLPITITGSYLINQQLSDSNRLTVSVNVTTAGTYTIYSDTVNGYSFSAEGTFKNIGSTQVVLAGKGTPTVAGTNYFKIFYNTSICQAAVVVKSTATPTASFTFKDAQGNCMSDTVNGSYVKDIVIDTFANLIVTVNVDTAGTFTIATDKVNGYQFLATGTFINTGIQTVKLTAAGTPVNAGTDVFTLKNKASQCTFPVTVLAAVVPTSNTSYFPLTLNSYWVYDDLTTAGDTIKRTITGTTIENGNTYWVMDEDKKYYPAQYKFRSLAGLYYEYMRFDKYTNSFQFAEEIDTTLYFLNDQLQAGTSWESDEIRANASFNQIIFLKYGYRCIQVNAVVTINGKAFANVYKIQMQPQIKSEFDVYGLTGETYNYYYAKGIGLIYMSEEIRGYKSVEMQIKDWLVN